ncbi:hypothetical protein [Roseovarius sp.]|uniref:hypothetical protein n=1 Tax=Roseovarius sp. TaxID=1486281 RepID=UPI0032F8F4ED
MTPEEKIKALEDQVMEVRHAAVAMVMGMAEAVTNGPNAREDLARGFDQAATQSDGETRRLAELVAEALRRTEDT